MQQEHQEPNDNHHLVVPPPTASLSSSFSLQGSSKFHRGVPRPAWNVRKGAPFVEPQGSPYPWHALSRSLSLFDRLRVVRYRVEDSSSMVMIGIQTQTDLSGRVHLKTLVA